MNFFYSYLVQSSVSLLVLYLIYWLFLKKDTFFSVNRFYLAGSIIFSLVFPLFRLNINIDYNTPGYVYWLETVTITPDEVESTIASHLSLLKIIAIIYLTGASLFFIRFIFQVFQVMKLVGKYHISRQEGIRIVFIDRNYQPFSFFGLVFIPEYLKNNDILPQILEHERVHIRQSHSLDLVLVEILTILQWYNPVIWLYRRSIKSIHEYLADEGVIIKGFDRINYQGILLGQSLGIQVNDLTNNFNHSLLKNRIIMMTKQKSHAHSGWKAFLAIPVLAGLVLIFSTSVNMTMGNEGRQTSSSVNNSGKPMPMDLGYTATPLEDTAKNISNTEPVYDVVKTMPDYKGGFNALSQYLVSSIKYPDEAKKNGITGTVFVSFIVDKTGKVRNVSILKSANPLLDDEALRVVSSMPDWNPGYDDNGIAVNVKFNLPIKFNLDADKAKTGEQK